MINEGKVLTHPQLVPAVLTEVEPHAPDLEAGLASHVLVLGHDPPPLIGGEVVQLQCRLREERDGTMEEVVPRLVLKLGEEEVSNCVREMAQGFQDHTGQERKLKIDILI